MHIKKGNDPIRMFFTCLHYIPAVRAYLIMHPSEWTTHTTSLVVTSHMDLYRFEWAESLDQGLVFRGFLLLLL